MRASRLSSLTRLILLGIDTARQRGLNALVIPSKGKAREEHDREVVAALKTNKVDLLCLAGYCGCCLRGSCSSFRERFSHSSLAAARISRTRSAGAGFRTE